MGNMINPISTGISLYDYAQGGYQGKSFVSDKVTEVKQYAFSDCKNLERVSMPNCEAIDINSFANCTNLKEFIAPKLAFIFEQAFMSSGIEELDLDELQDMGSNVFANTPLKRIVLRNPTEVAPFATTAFFNTPISRGEGFIYVTDSLLANYKTEYPDMASYFKPISLMNYVGNPVAWIDSEFNTEDGHSANAATLVDLSGNGNNGTIHGTIPYENKGYKFTGNAANYISIDALSQFKGNKSITIEVCFKLATLSGTQRILFAQSWYENYITVNKLHLESYWGGKITKEYNNTKLDMITTAITFDGNDRINYYVNGNLYGVASPTGTVNMSPAEIQLGQGNDTHAAANGTMFYGMRIYDRALTTKEIMKNYQNDIARFGA